MESIFSAVRRHPLLTFWVIAYATFYFAGVMMELFPSDLWYLFVYGSFLGGLIVTSIEGGKAGRKAWLSRITRWRVGWQWYAVAIAMPAVLIGSALAANLALGAPTPSSDDLTSWPTIVATFVFMFFFVSLGEDPGFKGFALPRILGGRSALATGLVLGVLHAGWHLPTIISGETPVLTVPSIVAAGVIMTWLFINAKGSVLLPMIYHSSNNAFFAYTRDMFQGRDASQQGILLSIIACLAAAAIVGVFDPTLRSRREEPRPTQTVAVQTVSP